METIYLARHATPDWSRSDLVYHLPPGPPLTEAGRQQAEVLGAYFLSVGVRQIFASPLERALHTAQIAGGIAGAAVSVVNELMEWQPAEQTAAVQARMRPALQQIIALSAHAGPQAIVSHGGPVGALLQELGMDEPTLAGWRVFDHHNPLPPAGAWRVQRPHSAAAWEFHLSFRPDPVRTL